MVCGFGGGKEFGIFDGVGEVVFVEVEAGSPFLAGAVAEILHKFGGGVSEPKGDRFVHGFFGEVESGVPGIGGGAGLFGLCEGDGGMGEDEAGFGHTDALDSLETGGGEGEGAIAGEADVLGSEDDHTAGDKLRIFAGLHHTGEIVEGGVDIGATQGLDEGRDGVVVVVALFVVAGEFLAGGVDNSVFSNMGGKRGGQLKVAKGGASVATAKLSKII